MYVIIVYDVNVERVNAVNKFLKKYLNWMQNSVFTGNLSDAKLQEVIEGINEIIDEKEDSIIIFKLPSKKSLEILTIGVEKVSPKTYNII